MSQSITQRIFGFRAPGSPAVSAATSSPITTEPGNAPLIEAVLRERTELRAHPSSEAEFMALLSGYVDPLNVDEYAALTNPAIWAAVNSCAQTFAMLPGGVYKRAANGDKEPVANHPVERLMKRRWNPIQTAYDGKLTFAANFLLRGGAYAELIRDKGQRLREMWLLPTNRVTPQQIGRTLRFDVAQADGTTAPIPHERMLWMNGLHLEGFKGIDPMWAHKRTIGSTLALDQYMRAFFSSGGNLRQALKYPYALDDEQVKRIKRRWHQLYGDPNDPHGVAVLEGGVEPTTIGVAPQAAQMTETQADCVRNAARMFNMPPARVGDHSNSTFNNMEQMGIEFVTFTMMPVTVCCESAINAQCFTEREQDEGLYYEFNLEMLLRGDTQSRYTAYGQGIKDGWLVRNEVRKRENLNPLEGLDEPLYPLNMGGAQNQPTQ